MKWIDISDKLPEDGLEVLCAITKHGMRTIDPSYTKITVDEDGKQWKRLGEQVEYCLLWRDEGIWENWEIDDFESNADYLSIIAWSEIQEYKLKNNLTSQCSSVDRAADL
jgi:hypothetical protein